MIPDYFFEDPFVFNVSVDDLVSCFFHETPEIHPFYTMSMIKEETEELETNRDFYSNLVWTYINTNLKNKGDYLVVHNGKTIVKACEEDGSIKGYFDEIGLDFSHLRGMSSADLQLLIIPCSMIKEPEMLRERLSGSLTAEIWSDGEISKQ